MAIDPSSGTTYISDVFDPNSGLWSLATIDRSTGQETIIGPQFDPTFDEFDTDIHALVMSDGTLYGFSFTRGLGVMNTSNGDFTPVLLFDSMPEVIENATIDPGRHGLRRRPVHWQHLHDRRLDGNRDLCRQPRRSSFFLRHRAGLFRRQPLRAGLQRQLQPPALSDRSFDHRGNDRWPRQHPRARRHDGAADLLGRRPAETSATYSFSLNQGESASIAIESLNGKKVAFSLLDDNGNVLGLSYTGAANYTAGLNNFVAQNDGTYYISVTGDPGLKFNLVVTRGADFTTQPHTTLATAQDITATEQSGNPKQGGALGYLSEPQRGDCWARPSKASTSTARTAAACRRTPTRRWATASWPRRSTSSSGSGTPPATCCSTSR